MSDKSKPSSDDPGPSQGRLVPVGSGAISRAPYGHYAAYPDGTPEFQSDLGLDLREYWRIFLKWKWLIASIALAAMAVNATRTLMVTPLYVSTTRIQITREAPQIIERGQIGTQDTYDMDFMKTQVELLLSSAIAERVASNLKLADDEDLFKPRGTSITQALTGAISGLFSGPGPEAVKRSRADFEREASGIVRGGISVRPVPSSSLVDISYSDTDPARAQRIAAGYVDAFIASTIDKRFQANAYAKTFLEDQIQQLKIRLEDSEKALLDFAQKEQIVAVTEKSSIAESNLAAANSALGNLISDRIKNENLWRQVEEADGINLPQLLTNTVIDGLRAKRNVLTTEYEEKLQTFKPSYPDMVQISNKIKEIDRQIAAEVATIRESLKGAYESALAQENEMKERVENLKAELLDLQKRSVQYNILKREVDTNRDLYNSLLQRFKEVDVAGGVQANTVFVVEKAGPGGLLAPSLSRALMMALAIGLGLGMGIAYLLEKLDDRIHSPDEMEQTLGLATLGVIPKAPKNKSAEDELADLRSALSEAYRSLCTSLQFATDSGLPKTMVLTSAGPGEGKSLSSLAIARHFATLGLKVLLVDADLRNASLHKKMQLENAIGLSNYLTGACTPPEAFQKTPVPNLAFMAAGPLPPNAADLLASAKMVSLLSVGLEVFDLIVVDGPPVMGLADAAILSNAASATVFVVGAGQSRTGQVRGALRRLQLARSPLIGAVLTKFDAKSAGYGSGYGYGYGYGYGDGKDAFTYGRPEQSDRPKLEDTRAAE